MAVAELAIVRHRRKLGVSHEDLLAARRAPHPASVGGEPQRGSVIVARRSHLHGLVACLGFAQLAAAASQPLDLGIGGGAHRRVLGAVQARHGQPAFAGATEPAQLRGVVAGDQLAELGQDAGLQARLPSAEVAGADGELRGATLRAHVGPRLTTDGGQRRAGGGLALVAQPRQLAHRIAALRGARPQLHAQRANAPGHDPLAACALVIQKRSREPHGAHSAAREREMNALGRRLGRAEHNISSASRGRIHRRSLLPSSTASE